MNLRRIFITASCREGARGRIARRAAADGDFVCALDETDRLLRIHPGPPPGAQRDEAHDEAHARILRALEALEPAPAPALAHTRWGRRAGVGLMFAAAAAAIALAPTLLWRSPAPRSGPPAPPAPGATLAASAQPTGPQPTGAQPASAAEPPRLTWTLVANFDHPLRAEAAALAADMRQFGHLVAPGVMPPLHDEQ